MQIVTGGASSLRSERIQKSFCAEESSLRKTCAIAFTLITFGAVCHAQYLPRSGNAFFGYSYSRGQVVNGSAIGISMNGWEATAEGKFLPWLGGVADFDWHYGGANTACIGTGCTSAKFRLNASRHSFLFGPRVSTSIGKYTPFAQVLLGLSNQTNTGGGVSTSDLAFANEVGGGLDYKLLQSVAARVQVDWIHTHLFGVGQNDFRMSTGIVFRF